MFLKENKVHVLLRFFSSAVKYKSEKKHILSARKIMTQKLLCIYVEHVWWPPPPSPYRSGLRNIDLTITFTGNTLPTHSPHSRSKDLVIWEVNATGDNSKRSWTNSVFLDICEHFVKFLAITLEHDSLFHLKK